MEQDSNISFLDDPIDKHIIPPPPPPPADAKYIPPPPPANEYVLRYNDNEMADILCLIPDKVPIWSRLFVSTRTQTISQRIESLQQCESSYVKCTQSSAEKDFRDALQQKMFDILLSSQYKTITMDRRKSHHQPQSPNLDSIKTSRNKAHSISMRSSPPQNIIKVTAMDKNMPIQVGAGEESDFDDYDVTMDDTDFDISIKKRRYLSMTISHPNSDNETNAKQYASAATIGAPRSKSSFNLKIHQVSATESMILPLPVMNQLSVGQQTFGSLEFSDHFSSSIAHKKSDGKTETNGSTGESDVSSLPSTSDKEEEMTENMRDVMVSNPLAKSISNGFHELNHQSPISPLDVITKEDVNVYERVIDIILEFAALTGSIYLDGHLMLHQMVYDIYTNEYNTVWHKYRLPIWLKLLFEEERMNELQNHYREGKRCNNYEHGQLEWIWNLHDMIYYDQTLFTHLVHCYGVPPTLQSLVWYHLSHNHHVCTDLDTFSDECSWKESDAPIVDYILDSMLRQKHKEDEIELILMKSFLFEPLSHHNAHSMNTQNILIRKNKKKMHLNLYYAHYRNEFYFDILHVLLESIWSELPFDCLLKMNEFWQQIEQQTNGNNAWLHGDFETIKGLLVSGECEFVLTVYLWDGMLGIGVLLTTIILIAIHSKKSMDEFYKEPLMKTEMSKIQKTYRFVYEYVVNKCECNSDSLSLIVLRKLCHLSAP